MKITLIASISTVLATACVQGIGAVAQGFEPPDFNVFQALLDKGVDITSLPQLSNPTGGHGNGSCSQACGVLELLYGSSDVLSRQSSAYDGFTSSYWSAQQGAVDPCCVFKPSTALQVSIVVLIARLTQCPFVVKGGGHAAFAGASSIEDGITISMERLNRIVVSPDRNVSDIGPGNHWVDVYSTLEKQNLTVIGGRISGVGVPGLILGGGISFFSNKYGWACDNVASYEVVTASGAIVTASSTSYPDLYWALRGGGNNFGIVTNFKLHTYAQGLMWGGQRIALNESFPAVLDAIHNFAITYSDQDPDAAQIVSFGYTEGCGALAAIQIEYAKPISNASVFNEINAIPAVQSTTGIHTLSELTIMMNEGIVYGARETYWGVSFKVNRELFTYLVDTFYKFLPRIIDAKGLLPVISIQVITEGQLKGMQKNGGNALGLEPAGGPYFIMNMGSNWNETADDARILEFNAKVIGLVKEKAKQLRADNDFIYMNYASQFQDVVAGYGAENKAKLIEVSKKYDPTGVFQILQPGYFKLEGAPNSTVP
ncbi:FAD-binding domain-containing protein [Lophiostoma macrostomum CBS 122681]|uniref:FAD-binding domain-containing protein n=1 Tax=Lophiostoma macrostomum CBS 122681 TaxID=1314788 RepID=A0A6A6SP90_9PLEO|nr:FAD-binding domain-containing protein [Lophiostoma macrostomum CBS 122681]